MTTLREAAQRALEALDCPGKAKTADEQDAITALKAALAEPEQEPVQEPYCYVYEYDAVFGLHREFYPRPYNGMKPSRTVPLYTAPPQRKPLTVDQIYEMYSEPRSDAEMVEFARAIERAHGIGGNNSLHKCKKCSAYFEKFSCGMKTIGECDCPKCQGYCEC